MWCALFFCPIKESIQLSVYIKGRLYYLAGLILQCQKQFFLGCNGLLCHNTAVAHILNFVAIGTARHSQMMFSGKG